MSPELRPLRSDYAVAAYAAGLLLLGGWALVRAWWRRRGAKPSAKSIAKMRDGDLYATLAALIVDNWELLDALAVAVGLFIYVVASHTRHQRRHPSAAIAWVLGILLVPYLTLPLYLIFFGSRKEVLPRQAPAPRRVEPAVVYGLAARAQQLSGDGLPDRVSYGALCIHQDGEQALAALRRVIDGACRTLE